VAGHALDCPLALLEVGDASEADADFAVFLEVQQARLNRAITAAPAARDGWLQLIATHSGHDHDRRLRPRKVELFSHAQPRL
jgi:hypothetical protein